MDSGDLLNPSEMMNVDDFISWSDTFPLEVEQMLASYTHVPYDQLDFSKQIHNTLGSPFGITNKASCPQIDSLATIPMDSSTTNDYNDDQQHNDIFVQNSKVPRSLGHSLAEKMLWALSLLKDSSAGGILAQVWVPIPVRDGCKHILSTSEQPFLHDQVLAGYREVSRSYTFSVERTTNSFPGLPGRVFMSKLPEWTSNVNYYDRTEYLRIRDAAEHEVRGSVALPIFSPYEVSCCAVLELVSAEANPHFDSEIEHVRRALQAVNLKTTTTPELKLQNLSMNQRSALAEITDVLRAVCHAHRLPLALIWMPCKLIVGSDGEVSLRTRAYLLDKSTLCIVEKSCYVNDIDLEGFVHACSKHPLEEGQGVVGKALQSNIPFFFPDVKKYHIDEYPLVHHARKFGLNAAVAIRLRNLHTTNDDYILEFFLPLSMTGNEEQQLLLDNLSSTMQRICRNLRTVSDEELVSKESCTRTTEGVCPTSNPMSEPTNLNTLDSQMMSSGRYNMTNDNSESVIPCEQGIKRPNEKKRSVAEKTVSLTVLQQHFAGSLKDAAKNLGVCPTTLKRICRQHGISRWPSRKINKVNRSLRKIQTVLDSVEGVEGGLKFDPIAGEIVATSSIRQELNPQKIIGDPNKIGNCRYMESTTLDEAVAPIFNSLDGEISSIKFEDDQYRSSYESQFVSEIQPSKNLHTIYGHIDNRSTISVGSYHSSNANDHRSLFDNEILSSKKLSRSIIGSKKPMDQVMKEYDGIIEHQQPTYSSMTYSSNGSGSGSMSSSQTFDKKGPKIGVRTEDSGTRMVVKATYKEDTIRFKFDREVGFLSLYEEVSKRFNLQPMTFQLKYLDDEDEWMLLQSEADFQECLEIMDVVATRSVKFLVRDLPFGGGSSGGSNCFLGGGL